MRDSALKLAQTPAGSGRATVGEELMRDSALKLLQRLTAHVRMQVQVGEELMRDSALKQSATGCRKTPSCWSEKSSCATAL